VSGRAWWAALVAFVGVLWFGAVNALLNVTASVFDLARWRWWLLIAALSATVAVGVAKATIAVRSTRPVGGRVWRVEAPEPGTEPRPDLADQIVVLLTSTEGGTVGMTTGLYGAGGFGKTTLARQVCQIKEVRRQFRSAVWVTVGESPSAEQLVDKVNDVAYQLTGQRPQVNDLEQAGLALGAILDQRRGVLLVIDDVWQAAHLRPFLHGGTRCTRLVTTRRPDVLPMETLRLRSVKVDQFSPTQARAVLIAGLPTLPDAQVAALLRLTGRWPLLVRLANRRLIADLHDGAPLDQAAARLISRLETDGPTTLDLADDTARDTAAAASIAASMDALPADDRDLFIQLGIFPEDVAVPFEVLALLWGATGGRSKTQVERLCERLHGLSLVADYHRGQHSLRLHDVIHAHLRLVGGKRLAETSRRMVDAARSYVVAPQDDKSTPWWLLPDEADYLWRHLCEHLAASGLTEELAALACDLRWVEAKVHRLGPPAVLADLALCTDPIPAALHRAIRQAAHLLGPIEPAHAWADTLVSRLADNPDLAPTVHSYMATLPPAVRLTSRWPLPDHAHPSLRHGLVGHTDSVIACAVGPSGTFVVTASRDETARIWDTATGTTRHTLTGHIGPLRGCALSPDGTFVVTTSEDSTARIWDSATGITQHILTGHAGPVTRCAISPDGTFVVTTSEDSTARIWDSATGAIRHTLSGHTGKVTACTLSPDGTFLVTAGRDGTARIWDSATGAIRHTLTGHTREVNECTLSPDGTSLVTASRDGTARIWDTATGTTRHTLTGHTGEVTECALSPDGTFVVTASWDSTARIWDSATGITRHTLTGHAGPLITCAISPDGTFVVTASGDGTAKIWESTTGATRHTFTGHSEWIIGCAVAPDGSFVVTTGHDNARIWDTATGTTRHTLTGHTGEVTGCAPSPDGTFVVTASSDGTARIWDTATGTTRHTLTGHTDQLNGCAVGPDGTFVVTISQDNAARMWDTATGTTRHILAGHADLVLGCAVGPDGTLVVTASSDGTARIWDTATGTTRHTLTGHTGEVGGIAVAPDGTFMVTTSYDYTARIWDTATGTTRHTLTGHTRPVLGCAVAPDGSFVVTTSHDDTARIWDTATGTTRHTLIGHTGSVVGCAVAPDGSFVVTTSWDGTARIWDIATGTTRHTLTGHTGLVTECALAPDGSFVVTVSHDGTVRVWDAVTGYPRAAIRVDTWLISCRCLPDESGILVAGYAGAYLFAITPPSGVQRPTSKANWPHRRQGRGVRPTAPSRRPTP